MSGAQGLGGPKGIVGRDAHRYAQMWYNRLGMSKAMPATTASGRVRRTQQERSAAMRVRLLDAAIDCLYELGYSGTTTIEVAARAGVSRGAQLHHFPTKERLVTDAVRHVLAKRLEEFTEAFRSLPDGADKPAAAIDMLWEKLSGRAFYAWLELLVAARTDPVLREAVAEIAGQFLDQVQATARDFFSTKEGSVIPVDMAPLIGFAAMQGLALDRIVWPADDERIDRCLNGLRALATMALRAHDSPRSASSEPTPSSSGSLPLA
jgi:AcrR family transcriptional regulator